MYNYSAKFVDSSRLVADLLTREIENSQEKFDELMSITFLDEYPLSMRAARVVYLCGIRNPGLFTSHIRKMITTLPRLKTDGVKRSFLKTLSSLPLVLNDEDNRALIDLAFEMVNDKKQSIAVRNYTIDLLIKLCARFPDLKTELIATITNLPVSESPALISKCKKTLTIFKHENDE